LTDEEEKDRSFRREANEVAKTHRMGGTEKTLGISKEVGGLLKKRKGKEDLPHQSRRAQKRLAKKVLDPK